MKTLVFLLIAAQLLRERAANGDPDAQFTLGKNYERKKDFAEAARWYRKSADQGNSYAEASLGIFYRAGKGVARDEVQAEMWFLVALDRAAAGDRDTLIEMRDSVAAHLTPQQLAEAQRLAREWKPK
jgi:TPR repeat protein